MDVPENAPTGPSAAHHLPMLGTVQNMHFAFSVCIVKVPPPSCPARFTAYVYPVAVALLLWGPQVGLG